MSLDATVHLERPANFKSRFSVSACYIIHHGKILFIRRTPQVDYPDLWCSPGGKANPGESPRACIKREDREETGIDVLEERYSAIGTLYLDYPDKSFEFNMFRLDLEKRPPVVLSKEHDKYRWVSIEEALKLNLLPSDRYVLEHAGQYFPDLVSRISSDRP